MVSVFHAPSPWNGQPAEKKICGVMRLCREKSVRFPMTYSYVYRIAEKVLHRGNIHSVSRHTSRVAPSNERYFRFICLSVTDIECIAPSQLHVCAVVLNIFFVCSLSLSLSLQPFKSNETMYYKTQQLAEANQNS